MEERPAVSIIMPSLNVGSYIRECIQSVVSQTLEDIEILCVDAGSTDGTLEVLKEFARKDHRVTVICSDKKSYGYQMNLGLDAAQGEYIGIVETDDWVEPDMFEKLWTAASAHNADMVKCNYYWYRTTPKEEDVPFENLAVCPYGKVFCPSEERTLFTRTPAIWSGIYKRAMLMENGVRFHETPGASFQDTSFHFMVCTVSQRCYLLTEYLHHYRRDNENSSVNSPAKVFCVRDEMLFYEAFLNTRRADRARLEKFFWSLRYEKYRWNYERLAPRFQWEFLSMMYEEFLDARERGVLERAQFCPKDWENVNRLLGNPIRYFRDTCKIYATRPRFSEIFPAKVLVRSKAAAPAVSVIIPCYNAQQYLAETLDSVLTQTELPVEVVCIDDGSDDGTPDILRAYAQKDVRVTVIRQINKGQSTARNVGMGESRGEFILFLDSDDLLAPGAVASLYARARRDELDILYYDGRSFYESEQLRQAYPYYETAYEYSAQLPDVLTGRELFCAMQRDGKYRVSPCLGLYRRDYLVREGISFQEGIIHEDIIFSLVSMLPCLKVGHTQEQFLIRRVRMGSTMTTAKTFMHIYGYLVSVLGMLKFVSETSYHGELDRFVAAETLTVINNTRANYNTLADKATCRSKLSAVELLVLDRVVLQSVQYVAVGTDEAVAIRASASYKIGRLITFVPRKLRSGMRCLREHGLRYTLGRVRAKLRQLFRGGSA